MLGLGVKEGVGNAEVMLTVSKEMLVISIHVVWSELLWHNDKWHMKRDRINGSTEFIIEIVLGFLGGG